MNHRFRARFVGLVLQICGRISDSGMEPYPPREAVAPRPSANYRTASGVGGFHTVRAGIDPGDHRFRPRFVVVVEI